MKDFYKLLDDSFIGSFFKEYKSTILEVLKELNKKNFIAKNIPTHKYDRYVEDELYTIFYSNLQPHTTTGDGDCLWNMISLTLLGNESLKKTLKLLTVLCMLLLKQNFLDLLNQQYKSIEKENSEAYSKIKFEEYLRIALDDKRWGNEYHMVALATVLGKNIYIYSKFKKDGKFQFRRNISKALLIGLFDTKSSKIGHHLRYEPLKNDFFVKADKNVLHGFYCDQHYTALIPKQNFTLGYLFLPQTSLLS
jgi:hypothetical protein